MRRALVLAAIAAPALASAQVTPLAAGELRGSDNFNALDRTSYLNAVHCGIAGEGGDPAPANLQWNVAIVSGASFTGTGNYQVYAANRAPEGDDGTFCPEEGAPNATPVITAGPAGDPVPVNATTGQFQEAAIPGKTIADAAGRPCSLQAEGQEVLVCAHWRDGAGRRGGWARGRFVIQVAAPDRPTDVRAGPESEDSLIVRWTPPTTGTPATHFVARATPLGDDGAPAGEPIRSSRVTAHRTSIDGLENGRSYEVVVLAYSVGGNESAASEPRLATPGPVDDFWETYGLAGGREQGGCGTGGTGPLALVAVGLLALLRRRT